MSQEDKNWKVFFRDVVPLEVQEMLQCNLNIQDSQLLVAEIKNNFVRDVYKSWFFYSFIEKGLENEGNKMIWFNSNIRIQNEPIFIKQLYEKGIVTFKDLLNDGKVMSFIELKNKYDVNINFVTYYGLLSAIPRNWKEHDVLINYAEDVVLSNDELLSQLITTDHHG